MSKVLDPSAPSGPSSAGTPSEPGTGYSRIRHSGTERGLRGVVVGRKNHYGSKSRRGTEVAALFYSLIESAKLAGVEPKAYLRLAVQAALRGEKAPLPHQIAAAA